MQHSMRVLKGLGLRVQSSWGTAIALRTPETYEYNYSTQYEVTMYQL